MSDTEQYPRSTDLAPHELHLDPQNPRLPEDVQGADEPRLLDYIARNYFPLEVARSIARYGYFISEPLIAIEEPPGRLTVVEGNRRLVAILLLEDPARAQVFPTKRSGASCQASPMSRGTSRPSCRWLSRRTGSRSHR
jgi:hypothetical protein